VLDDRSSYAGAGKEGDFLFTASRPDLESTQSPIQWVPGTLFTAVKRPGRETKHFIDGIIPLTPPYIIIEWYLVKHRDNFTCSFYML
jgi:hypothetical protein